jgi:uncharacterized SAM-binding protein YcdF (DUF218 family)
MKWLLGLYLLWLAYIFVTIVSFPSGKLSDTADAAIVLGAAVYNSKPSPVFAERINHAINLYNAGKVSKLIFTGGIGGKNELAESTVARNYAISRKVRVEDIRVETQSLTTKQNLMYAKQIIDNEKNLDTLLIISDPLHLKRAMLIANKLKLNAKPSATPTSRYQSLRTKLPFAFRELYFYHHYLLFTE